MMDFIVSSGLIFLGLLFFVPLVLVVNLDAKLWRLRLEYDQLEARLWLVEQQSRASMQTRSKGDGK